MKKIDEIIPISKEEFGFESDGFDMARRDVVTVSNLIDHIHRESGKAYNLMLQIREYNEAYRGNKDVLESLAIINLASSDAHDFLSDDKKTLGTLEDEGN